MKTAGGRSVSGVSLRHRLGAVLFLAAAVSVLGYSRLNAVAVAAGVDQPSISQGASLPSRQIETSRSRDEMGSVAPRAVSSNEPTRTRRQPVPNDVERAALEALFDAVVALPQNVTPSSISQSDIDAYCEVHRARVWARLEATGDSEFLRRLKQQRAMHEAVASGNAPPTQKYLVWSLSGGLGNRFLSLASSFVTAMVSRRVFLMKDWFTPLPPGWVKSTPVILPSPRSTEYFLEDLSKLFGAGWPRNDQLLCPLLPMMSLRDFAARYPEAFAREQHSEHAKVDIAARHDKHLKRWDRFLCSRLDDDGAAPQQGRRNAGDNRSTTFFTEKFVYVWTNQYYLPVLYANPYHSAEMQAMFPRGQPYQQLIGLLAIPSLPVVARLKEFFGNEARQGGVSLTGAFSKYDGLQIRAFRTNEIATMAQDFDSCFKAARKSAGEAESPFFLGSMHGVVRKYFEKHYGGQVRTSAPPTEVQLTSNATADQNAMTDMMVLAFARKLYVSPGSTFGMFVAAFAKKSPIAVRAQGACRVVASVEPCFGAWFRRDHLLRRSLQQPSPLSCRLAAVPSSVINCEQS